MSKKRKAELKAELEALARIEAWVEARSTPEQKKMRKIIRAAHINCHDQIDLRGED